MISHLRFIPLFFILLLLMSSCASDPVIEPATVDPLAIAGKAVFTKYKCAACHAMTEGTVILGPSFAGLKERAENRMTNLTAEQYIEQSIMNPSAYIVTGFEDAMPSTFGKKLTGEELDALVYYLLTFENE